MNNRHPLERLMDERILIMDGAMGTALQRYGLTEADFRGARFAEHGTDLRGDSDVLILTRPDVVRAIHDAYLDAGADLIETNTFTATSIAQADYALSHLAYELNVEGARLARAAVDARNASDPSRQRFVLGSMGPLNRTLSLSPDVNDPGYRAVTFDGVAAAYAEQVRGLLDGGVDALLVETIFDTLNAKAALWAIQAVFEERATSVPIMISVTITDASGRTLSGQTLEAFLISVEHAHPLTVGINCALGGREMRPFVEELATLARTRVCVYPNAGLPNAFGGYDETPEDTAAILREFADQGWLNAAGGCCGTTPDHIAVVARALAGARPRPLPATWPHRGLSHYSGLEPYVLRPDANFTLIGERTNVTGSKRFAKLIKGGQFDQALAVARDQVEGGANIIDVNMDEGLLDSTAAMTRFLNLVAAEPDISRVPVMVDSSKLEVIEAGLRCLQGKSIVNSISLKEGEAAFIAAARSIRRFGAAVVVMCFDEQGQAVDAAHKVAIAERAYRLLTERCDYDPTDIIIDPNILAIATGIAEHDNYAVDFIEATREIKRRCPGVKISGGVSNLSFSFRGQEAVREAMHAAFLYHAIGAGMDMGIVNAGQLAVYEEIPPELLTSVEDVILNRRPDATERLVALAERISSVGKTREKDDAWRQAPLQERITHALVKGVVDHIEEDVAEALAAYGSALTVIEEPLMSGMKVVGDLFGAGKMFLPQVVKSARAMKKAVAWLQPHMEAEAAGAGAGTRGTVLLATVKGDVHDIGKNIVGVVLRCNNYEVVDLGVMVAAQTILDKAREIGADIVGLSGLITPSLDEMVHVARELERTGFEVPLLIGGATTSRKHTAVKVDPVYHGPVVHVLDASRAAGVVTSLLSADKRADFLADNAAAFATDRLRFSQRQSARLVRYSEARERRPRLDFSALPVPDALGPRTIAPIPLEALVPLIDWTPFFSSWELKGNFPKILEDEVVGAAARELYANARAMLERVVAERWLEARAVFGFFPANADGDDVVVWTDETRSAVRARFPMLRQQRERPGDDAHYTSLADFVAPSGPDHLGLFAVTSGHGVAERVAEYEADHDDYQAILLKALADRLAEAAAEWLHAEARRAWGFGRSEDLSVSQLHAEDYRGIRPAPGYPACPDHTEKATLFALLDAEAATGIQLTESMAMTPPASVSGYYFAHPGAHYFTVGPLGRDQLSEYALRKGTRMTDVERWLAPWLAYDAD
ncbi:MAG: methionine synthase [Deltaproteobacteria bacterium HGW-Deltaproteobacteria-14]|jgi:5-methyltetrahydrofolate--homocysteine methyltransferase|nr:MAG: methionine synthase [Deltaproteobacteria bacterium HGW-Deltaproteobacteria-14]